MFYRHSGLCLFFGCFLFKYVVTDPKEIKLRIFIQNKTAYCEPSNKHLKTFYVLKDDKISIVIDHTKDIYYMFCDDEGKELVNNLDFNGGKITTFTVTEKLNTTWKCRILFNKGLNYVQPVIKYNDFNFTQVTCQFRLQVMPRVFPLVLINNVVLELDHDINSPADNFHTEYNYADGDIVQVTCIKDGFKTIELKLQYNYKKSISDLVAKNPISSYKEVGFKSILNSGHSGSSVICYFKKDKQTFSVKIKLVMATKFNNKMNISFNGLSFRSNTAISATQSDIEYIYTNSEQIIDLVCESNRKDLEIDRSSEEECDNDDKCSKMLRKSIKPENGTNTSCGVNKTGNERGYAFLYRVTFTKKIKPNSDCELHMDLKPNKSVLELEMENKEKIIYYEYKYYDNLNIDCYGKCGLAVEYLWMKNITGNNKISTTVNLNSDKQPNITCYAKEKTDGQKVLKAITLVFINDGSPRVEPTTTDLPDTTITDDLIEPEPLEKDEPISLWILLAAAAVMCIVICCVTTVIIKMRKRNQCPQVRPYEQDYVDLQNEVTIPPHPVQWESPYAVPVDHRDDNVTYTVPYKPESDIYTKPIPKSERKKDKIEPTYAALNLPKVDGKFRGANESNYAVIRNVEECYAKVAPKSQRKKAKEADISNEPTYCEPQLLDLGSDAPYSNTFDNTGYANAHRTEYIEPTYCEPAKKRK